MTGPGRLFVYGTLRRGGGAPADLRRFLAARTERLGTGVVEGRLLDAGAFPAAVPDGEGRIRGEVLEMETPGEVLPVLDRYEGCRGPGPDLFRRETVRVRLEGGGSTEAWAYVYDGDARRLPEIESGDWLERGE